MTDTIALSVITATWQRPKHLALCLWQYAQQSTGGLACEQLVVSDGPDQIARGLAQQYGARYVEREEPGGQAGAFAKDAGIEAARGNYVCFWDDDNQYERHALAALYGAAYGADIGVVQTKHRDAGGFRVIPSEWTGNFQLNQIDTMCVCVCRRLAERVRWSDGTVPGTDHQWLTQLAEQAEQIRFVPVIIGRHL